MHPKIFQDCFFGKFTILQLDFRGMEYEKGAKEDEGVEKKRTENDGKA